MLQFDYFSCHTMMLVVQPKNNMHGAMKKCYTNNNVTSMLPCIQYIYIDNVHICIHVTQIAITHVYNRGPT
jgi:hypothetical protein